MFRINPVSRTVSINGSISTVDLLPAEINAGILEITWHSLMDACPNRIDTDRAISRFYRVGYLYAAGKNVLRNSSSLDTESGLLYHNTQYAPARPIADEYGTLLNVGGLGDNSAEEQAVVSLFVNAPLWQPFQQPIDSVRIDMKSSASAELVITRWAHTSVTVDGTPVPVNPRNDNAPVAPELGINPYPTPSEFCESLGFEDPDAGDLVVTLPATGEVIPFPGDTGTYTVAISGTATLSTYSGNPGDGAGYYGDQAQSNQYADLGGSTPFQGLPYLSTRTYSGTISIANGDPMQWIDSNYTDNSGAFTLTFFD